jgi:hypothetical protein
MVSRGYLLKKPAPPSPVQAFVNQSVVPTLIDAAAAIEQRLERIACGVRCAPMFGLGMAVAMGWLTAQIFRSSRAGKGL